MRERGSSLLEILAIGAGAVLLVAQSLVGIARVGATAEAVSAAARGAAVTAARTGGDAFQVATDLAPAGSRVEVDAESGHVEVVIRATVTVLGPIGVPVVGRATAESSPYRSNP